MAWCPKCKNEYRAGITYCSDCKCDLVDSLEEAELVKVFYGPEDGLASIKEYLEFNDISPVSIEYDEEEGANCLMVPEAKKVESIKYISTYLHEQEILKVHVDEDNDEEFEVIEQPKEKPVLGIGSDYTSSKKRAEDNKSSGYALIGVGILGLVFVVLVYFDLLPIPVRNNVPLMIVLALMFIAFIVLGFVSFKNAKKYEKKVESEDSITNTVREWVKENLDAQKVDALIGNPGLMEEERYFYRVLALKDRLNKQFMNLDQAFLESFIDEELYDLIFPNE